MGLGTWALLIVSRWVGLHWLDARPAVVYIALRWLVSILAGLAVAAVFQWWGDAIAKAAHEGPFGWLDRLVGGALGAAMGLALAALLTLALLQAPALAATGRVAEQGRCSKPLVQGGAAVTGAVGARVPGGAWLHRQFVTAARRLTGGHSPARAVGGL